MHLAGMTKSAVREQLEEAIRAFVTGRFLTERLKSETAQAEELQDFLTLRMRAVPVAPDEIELREWWEDVRLAVKRRMRLPEHWPSTQQFADAVDEVNAARSARVKVQGVRALPDAESRNDLPIWHYDALAIRAHKPVSDRAIFGMRARQMLEAGAVTLEDLEIYRRHWRIRAIAVWGEAEAARMEQRLSTDYEERVQLSLRGEPKDLDAILAGITKRFPQSLDSEDEPREPPTTDEIVKRPYTDEERARMHALHRGPSKPEPSKDLNLESNTDFPRAQGDEP